MRVAQAETRLKTSDDTSIQFGLAELSASALTGAQVTLSSGATLSFNLSLLDPFAEGQFTFSGSPVTSFHLTPAPGANALAFDNLTVTTVPLPPAILLFGTALVGLGILTRRRNSAGGPTARCRFGS